MFVVFFGIFSNSNICIAWRDISVMTDSKLDQFFKVHVWWNA